jgi:shikimate kinase
MKPIYLIGFMGSGKTTLGKILAEHLNLDFIDLDSYIESEYNLSVHEIFNKYGEDEFRLVEWSNLNIVSKLNDVIISTGGGTPCFFNNIDFMNVNGITIFFDEDIDVIYNRLLNDKSNRPLISNLSNSDLYNYISDKLNERKKYYNKSKLKINSKGLKNLYEQLNGNN